VSRTEKFDGWEATFKDEDQITGFGRKIVRASAQAAESALRKYPELAFRPAPAEETAEERDARLVEVGEALAKVRFTLHESLALQTMYEASAVALLESWTRPEPLPTIDTIGELPGDVYDALIAATRGVPPSASETDFTTSSDADSPTIDSGSSNLSSTKDDPGSPPTTKSSSAGKASSGEPSSPEPSGTTSSS